MGHKDHYHQGVKLVSATELTSIIAKPFLQKWQESLCCPEKGQCGFERGRQVADEAADLGNRVHAEIESWFLKHELAVNANDWSNKIVALYKENNVVPAVIAPEETVLDRESNLAGSPDHVIMWKGELAIGDLKIKNQLDPLTAMQGCAYRYLIKRIHKTDISKMLVVHCQKKTVSQKVKPVLIDLDEHMATWHSLVKLWNYINPSRKVKLHD